MVFAAELILCGDWIYIVKVLRHAGPIVYTFSVRPVIRDSVLYFILTFISSPVIYRSQLTVSSVS